MEIAAVAVAGSVARSIRGSIWARDFPVGAGAPGGVRGPCASAAAQRQRSNPDSLAAASNLEEKSIGFMGSTGGSMAYNARWETTSLARTCHRA